MSHKFSIAKHRKRREDMISEDAIPDLTTLFQVLHCTTPQSTAPPHSPLHNNTDQCTTPSRCWAGWLQSSGPSDPSELRGNP